MLMLLENKKEYSFIHTYTYITEPNYIQNNPFCGTIINCLLMFPFLKNETAVINFRLFLGCLS